MRGFRRKSCSVYRKKPGRFSCERLEPRIVLDGSPVISEFMSLNEQTIFDEDRENSDWIEIFNAGDSSLNLDGYFLTDNPDNLEKWEFPSVELGTGEFLLVYASNKNRTDPAGELHTNFKLRGNGEFLAIVDPDGSTIVHAFEPNFPPQIADVSFGLGADIVTEVLLPFGATADYLSPDDNSLGTQWQDPDYTLGSLGETWNSGPTALGFDTGESEAGNFSSAVLDFDPIGYWRLGESVGGAAVNLGTLGDAADGQYNGGASQDVTGIRPPAFAGLEQSNGAVGLDGANDSITTDQSLLSDLGEFTMMGFIRPDTFTNNRVGLFGQNDAIEFGFINPTTLQIWTPSGGSLNVAYPFSRNEWHHIAVVGSGSNLTMYLDGQISGTGGGNTGNYGSSNDNFNIGGSGIFDGTGNWFEGDIDEVAVFDYALTAQQIDELVAAASGEGDAGGDFNPLIQTNVQADMLGENGSLYVRIPFTVDDVSEIKQLTLQIKYDDGFVAYLNGSEVARRNAPVLPTWNSVATMAHSDSQAVIAEEINISDFSDALLLGENVLAIHALNQAVDGQDFFLDASLESSVISIGFDTAGYMTNPTPGAPNNFASSDLGPIVGDVESNSQQPTVADSIIVQATVAATLNPVANVDLKYRVMFGSERTIAMADDGLGSDLVAGDGIYTAVIPAGVAQTGQMVRWYVEAKDTEAASGRAPLFQVRTSRDQSPEYFGTVIADASVSSDLPIMYWFVQNPSAARTRSGTRASLFYNGEFYDNFFVRQRGGSTASGGPVGKSHYKFDFLGEQFRFDPQFPRVEEFNLNSTASDKAFIRQPLAFETYDALGSPGSISFNVRVQQNGQFFGVFSFIEQVDDELLAREGLDPNGALYKVFNEFLGNGNARKQTRTFEGNQDLTSFISSVNRLSGQALTNYLFDNVDVPRMMNYLVGTVIVHQNDNPHKNHYLYRDTEGTGEWMFISWDNDQTFGSNWIGNQGGSFSDTIYADNDSVPGQGSLVKPSHPFINDRTHQEWNHHWNRLMDAMLNEPSMREMYLRRLRSAMDEMLGPPDTPVEQRYLETQIDEMVQRQTPDVELDLAKWANPWRWGQNQSFEDAINIIKNEYLDVRRVHLYENHSINNPGFPDNAGIPNAQIGNPQINIDAGNIEYNPTSGNQDEEYIPLTNPNPFAVDISEWRLTGAVQYTFKKGTIIPAGGTLYVSPNVPAFRARSTGVSGGQGLFVQGDYQGEISSLGERLELSAVDGQSIHTVTTPVDPSEVQQSLRISEIMFRPDGPEPAGPFSPGQYEFVELINIGDATLDLTNVSFVEGVRFSFAGSAVTSLASGERTVIVRNESAFESRYDLTGIKIAGVYDGALDNDGDRLRLQESSGESILDFRYDDSWHPVTDGEGFSLNIIDLEANHESWQDAGNWQPSRFLHGSPGEDDPGGLPNPGDVILSEVLANTDTASDRWIEIFNTTGEAIDIGGWFLSGWRSLSNDPAQNVGVSTDPQKFQIFEGTIIPANGYLTFNEADHFGPAAANPLSGFSLATGGGSVAISAGELGGALLGYRDVREFDAVESGVSVGLYIDSQSQQQFVPLSIATPGEINTDPLVGPIAINEIHYNPSAGGDEFIELHNRSDKAVSLSGWQFDRGVTFAFGDVVLAAGDYLVISGIDPDTFRANNDIGDEIMVLGPYTGQLDNGGETIGLLKKSTGDLLVLADRVKYNDRAPWPITPDGGGQSLSRLDATTFANDPENWSAGIPGGTPGEKNVLFDETPPTAPGTPELVVLTGPQISLNWTGSFDAETGVDSYIIYRDNRAIATVTDTQYIDSNIVANVLYTYHVTALNGSSVEGSPGGSQQVLIFDVLGAVAIDDNHVRVSFTDSVSQATAQQIANYQIAAGAINITAAVLEAGGQSVLLTTEQILAQGQPYRVTVENVAGASQGVVNPDANAIFVPGVSSGGVTGEYFNNTDFSGEPVLRRTDLSINFNWGSGSPDATINADNFSARWTGSITPEFGEVYTFRVLADDAARVWVNDELVFDGIATGENQGPIDLSLFAGRKVPFRLEYIETTNTARMQLAWGSASQPLAIMPSNAFSTAVAVEQIAPTVTGIQVSSSDWTPEFIGAIDTAGFGSGGIDLPLAPGSNPITWPIDQISITFNEDVKVEAADLLVPGHTVASVDYDFNTFTATWTLARPATAENMQIQLAAGLTDLAGNSVEGDSNVGVVAILAGDVDGSGLVDNADIRDMMRHQFTRVGDGAYSIRHDLNGDGVVNFIDLINARDARGGAIVVASPLATSPVRVTLDSALTLETLGGTTSDSDIAKAETSAASRLTKATIDSALIEMSAKSNSVGDADETSGNRRLNRSLRSRSRLTVARLAALGSTDEVDLF